MIEFNDDHCTVHLIVNQIFGCIQNNRFNEIISSLSRAQSQDNFIEKFILWPNEQVLWVVSAYAPKFPNLNGKMKQISLVISETMER